MKKKILAVILCMVLLFCSLGAINISAESEYCDCGFDPVIKMTGGAGSLIENYGQPDEISLYGEDFANIQRDIVPGIPDFLAAVAAATVTFNPNKLVDAIIALFDPWISPLAMNPDGTSARPNITRPNYNEKEEMAQNHSAIDARYTFPFDWRLSPFENAEKLDSYIQEIKEHTGHRHVHIQAVSSSGPVLLAYVDRYVNGVDDPDAKSVVFGMTTSFGMSLMGHFLNARYNINPKGLNEIAYLYKLTLGDFTNTSVTAITNLLYNTGVFDALGMAVSLLPQAAYDRIYEEITRKTYAAWPGSWATCPPEEYAEARARLVGGTVYGGDEMLEKLDAYYNLQLKADKVLQEANENIKVSVMTGYNFSPLPLGRNDNSSSDGLVSVYHASLGAIAAPLGRKLPSNYKQAVNTGKDQISPDWKIDASAAALPEYTWFFKYTVHGPWYEFGGWYSWWRFAAKGQDTVFSNDKWPQFLQNPKSSIIDDVNVVFTPVAVEKPGIFDTILNFWDRLLTLMRNLFDVAAAPFSPLLDRFCSYWF